MADGGMTPQESLMELGRALEYALRNPTFDKTGTLFFGVERIGGRDPISRPGGRCPTRQEGGYSLPDLAQLAGLVRTYASQLGGGRPGSR